MRLETSALRATPLDRIEALRLTYEDARPEDVLAGVLAEFPGEVALVSSFGAEAAVLLHMVAEIDRRLPVLMIDSLMLFEETLEYQRDLSRHLGLTNVQHLHPDATDLARLDPDDTLHQRDHDACCVIRKVAPLDRALRRWPVTITGRKRFQAATRAGLDVFEADARRLRVNPLAHWRAGDLRAYMDRHDLPRHPLVARGYPSIGCAPCTTRVMPGEDERAGPLARQRQGRVRHSFRRGWTHPARGKLRRRAMSVLVTDRGFGQDDWTGEVLPFDIFWSGQDLPEEGLAVEFPNDRDPADLAPWLERLALIRVAFPAMSDGRGFSIARRLRDMGYAGRLRAAGPLVADQLRAARRVGFDEVELPEAMAERQPEAMWRVRPQGSYQDRVMA